MTTEIIKRVLIIGIDGGTFNVLHPLMDAGHLPTLKGLMAEGVHGDLRSTLPPITGPAWRTFATGCNPGKHGVIDFVELDRETRQVKVKEISGIPTPTFWDIAARHDRRVALMGIPMTYPPQPVNGVLLTGMMTPPGSQRYCYPAALHQELESAGLRWLTSTGENRNAARTGEYFTSLIEEMAARVDTAIYLLEREQPEIITFIFDASDPVQHQFYHVLEEGGPEQAQIEAFFRALDDGCRRLIAAAGEDTLVLVMSDHGFGRLRGFIHLNNWLLERGYLQLRRDPLTHLRLLLHRLGYTPENLYLLIRRLGIDPRRNLNRGRMYRLMRLAFLSFNNVDWSQTRAYALGHIGQVYITPPPGSRVTEYQALCDQLRTELLEMRHPQTGEKLMEAVHHRDEIYSGPYSENAPDLILEPAGYEYVAFGESEFASNQIIGPGLHSGHHRMEGVLILSGPGIRRDQTPLAAQIGDIAPSILYMLGLPIPTYMDGQPLTAIFTPEYVEEHPVQYEEYPLPLPGDKDDSGYSEQEEALVRQRLKDLGYTA